MYVGRLVELNTIGLRVEKRDSEVLRFSKGNVHECADDESDVESCCKRRE